MALVAGTRLGPYEIISPLGAGGMGEVYRANDSRLRRQVAVKILAAHAAGAPDARARLEREARAIAALNDPHICTLYDVGASGDLDYLVMELIEGETLAARLVRAPMAIPEVMRIGAEIASALQHAHRAGVLHRDLKPGNVMLTRNGSKLMDFGLARLSKWSTFAVRDTQSPTESAPITGEGQLAGTFRYMSPEQLEGHEADARSDIWALGATLYEMATRRPAFEGASTASLVSAIMKGEPRPLSAHAPLSPPAFERLVRICLEKDPDSRWQSAGDLARELDWLARRTGTVDEAPATPAGFLQRTRRNALWLAAAAVATVALGAATFPLWRPLLPSPSTGVVKSELVFSNTSSFGVERYEMSLSPDGTMLAASLPDSSGRFRILIRKLNDLEARVLPGSEGGHRPFWSPDSRDLAFFTDEGRLERLGVRGGVPQNICRAPNAGFGSWSPRGWIIFGAGPIMRVSATGGTPTRVTMLDSLRHESGHEHPDFLPDGRHFTFIVYPGKSPTEYNVRVGSVEGAPDHFLMTAHHAPRSDGHGWLVYMRDRAMFAQKIDPAGRRLMGPSIPMNLAPERMGGPNDPIAYVAADLLAFEPEDTRPVRLRWYDRHGIPGRVITELESHSIDAELSPDGRFLISYRAQGFETWMVLVDTQTGAQRRLTSPDEWNSYAVWSPTGNRIIYSALVGLGRYEIRSMDADEPETPRSLMSATRWTVPVVALPGDTNLMCMHFGRGTGADLFVRDLGPAGGEHDYAASRANEMDAELLPDGKALAFVSDVTGRNEIYIDEYPERHHATPITRDGASTLWPVKIVRDQMIYIGPDDRTVRSIRLHRVDGRWLAGEDQALFVLPYGYVGFCPSNDAERFLVMEPRGAPRAPSVTIVQNWKAELSR